MAKNILVNGKNNITARANAMADIQTSMANSTSATNVNTTPNLPTSITRPERTINLQKAQQPVNTKLENLNQATGKITGNNPAFYNGQLISQNNQPSRFIGFQQPTTLNSTQPQAKSFNKLMNGGYGYIASDVNKAESANRKEEQRYRNMSEAFYDLQGTLYNRGKTLSENEIRQKFPEFKDLDMNVLNDLQNELLPIVSSGMGVDADQISQIYPELLKGKELKDVEDIKKKSELSNKNFQQLDKTISKALKTDWELYSTNGLKYIQNAKKITDAVKIAKQQGIVGGANDFEIARELAKSNPELQQAIKEMNRLELTESDKVRLGKSGNLLVAAREGLQTGIWNDIFGESETPISDEELDSAIRARDKLENDFWRQTGKKIATEIGVPLDSLEKFTYKTYKDIQNKILETGMEYTKDYAKKQIKSAFKEGLGVELTDEQLNSIDNVYNTAVAPSINEQIKTNQQNVMDYIESVNKEYESRKRRNLDTDVENYVNNRSMTQSLLAGDLSSFGYKAAGETAQNAEMPLIIAAGAVAPEVVLPLMAVDSYSRENQEAFEELTKAGANYEQAQEGAAIVGLASSAVEVGLEKLLGGVETTASKALHDALIKDFTKKATEMVAERGLVDILKQGATTQFRSSLEEGLEEVLQQVIHNRAVQQYDPNQEITEGLLESFEGGFFNPMNLLAGGGEVYGGIKNNSETIKQNAYETAYNLGQKTRQVTDKVDNALNKGAYNAGRGARIVTDAVENAKNKITSQGGKYNTQGQQQVQEVNTTSENENNINGENYTENGGWSQPKKGVIGKALSGIGKAYDSTVGKAIDTVAEKGAEAITSTSTPQDKLFQAVSPTLNKLTNKRGNYEQKRQNADRTNELIVEYGHTPTNSTEYYDALIKTKNALWKNEIQRGLDEHKYTTISSKELTDAVRDEMQEDARFPLETNKSDLAKLNKELASLDRQGELTLEQLEAIKQQINAKLNYGKNAEAGEIYEKGLRAMNTKISQIEDQLIAKLPGEFTKFKKDYGALKDMEEDVLKMMLKDMKKKDGGGITQNIGRIAGIGKLLTSPLEGTMQIIFGEVVGKAKETNFLIQKGFEDLRNQYKGEKKTLDVKDKPAEKVLALPDGIKLTKVTEIDNRKPKNKVTKKNNKSDNNKKSDTSSSDDTTPPSGGTPTGGTPTGTNPTNNQGGTTDNTKTKKQPKKKADTKTKTTSKKSAVTDYINETPQNERGQMEEIEAEENLRNNETPQRDMVEETPKNKVTSKKAEATAPKNKTVDISNVKNISDLRSNLENKAVGDHRVDYGYINGKYYEIEEFVGEYHIVEGDKPSDINHAKNGVAIGGQYVNTINGLKAFIEGKSNGEVIKADRTEETTPKQEENQTKKAESKTAKDPELREKIGDRFYDYLQKQVDIINENRKEFGKEPITVEDLNLNDELYINKFEKIAQKELSEIQNELSEINKDLPQAPALTDNQREQLNKAENQAERNKLLRKWQDEWLENNPISEEKAEQIREIMERAADIIEQHNKARNYIYELEESEENKEYEDKYSEESKTKATTNAKNKVTNTEKSEKKSDSEHFSYETYGEFMKKYEAAEKEINDRLDKQMDKERAEKMSRFEELRDKEDKTDAEGNEMMKLAGELNNMSNKYDRLKEQEFNKKHPELVAEKQRQNEMFDRDWKATMDKKMEEMEKPFNDLRDEFRQKLRDELGIADDIILDEKYYNSLTPAQKETADRINKEFADKYEELRKRAAGEEIIPEIKKAVEKKQEKPKKKQTKKEEKEARVRGLAKPDGNLIYSSGERKYVPSLKEGLIRLTKEEGQKKFKEQLGNAFRGGLEITVREDNESPYYDADRFFIYNPDREGIEEWEDRDIEELTINGDNIKEFEVYNDGDVDIIIDDPYIEGKDREIILDLKDFLNYSNMTRYIGKAHPRNLLGGSKNKVTSSAPIDAFEDLDFWTIKELKDRGDQAAIDLYEEMGIEDEALEELYKEMLIEENETPQRPSIFDEELQTERQLSENETAQIPTIFEEDLEQMNLRELDENETPQTVEEEKTKIVDKDGNPLRVYHGTNMEGDEYGDIRTEPGYWFTEDRDYAKTHSEKGIVREANLDMKKPINIDEQEEVVNGLLKDAFGDKAKRDDEHVFSKEFKNAAIKKGYDGLIFSHDDANTYIVFNKDQIIPLKPQNVVTDKANVTSKQAENEKPKNLVTSEQQSEFETLPADVTVSQEAKQLGAKRIAPDRVPRQQLTFDEGSKKIQEQVKTVADYIQLKKDYYDDMYGQYEGDKDSAKIMVDYSKAKKDIQQILWEDWQFKSNKSKEFTDLRNNIKDNIGNEKGLNEVGKNFYISKVKKDISKGYVYPQEVLDKIPGANKAIDNRERYEKGLNTSFSAKDERIDYSEKDKIGAGMKSQDGKQITKEQKEDIVKGILDFGKTLGLDMKKFAEDRGLVYVHLHGGLAFLNNMAAGLYRESTNEQGEKNISVSVGGAENVRYKDKKTKERKTTTLNTTMSHELGHAMDALLDNKLFSWTQKSILGSKYNPVNRLRNYYAKGNEIVARAIEQYVAVENGQPNYYEENGNLDAGELKGTDLEYYLKELGSYYERPGYWSKPDYEKYVKPYVEEAFKNNFEEYRLNKSQKKNVLSNDKNKITSK